MHGIHLLNVKQSLTYLNVYRCAVTCGMCIVNGVQRELILHLFWYLCIFNIRLKKYVSDCPISPLMIPCQNHHSPHPADWSSVLHVTFFWSSCFGGMFHKNRSLSVNFHAGICSVHDLKTFKSKEELFNPKTFTFFCFF